MDHVQRMEKKLKSMANSRHERADLELVGKSMPTRSEHVEMVNNQLSAKQSVVSQSYRSNHKTISLEQRGLSAHVDKKNDFNEDASDQRA